MKAEIDAAIKAIVDDIAERQEALKALRKLGGYDTTPMNQPIPAAPTARRGPKPLDVRNKRGPYKKRETAPAARGDARPTKTTPTPPPCALR